MNNFEFAQQLEKRLLEFSKKVGALCQKIPKDRINQSYADQLNRSTCSIGANYIEANESLSNKDFFHRARICRKEAKEAIYWFEIVGHSNLQLQSEAKILQAEANEYLRIFSSIISKAK